MSALPGTSKPLTMAQRRHLYDLQVIAAGNAGEAAWHPENAGEWRCAEALVRRGLLKRHVSRGSRPFTLTAAGREVKV